MNDDCLKLTTYFGERDRAGDRLVADALLDLYGRAGVEASLLLRGVEGFGLRHHLRTDRLLSLSEDLPLVSVAVDSRERIESLLPRVTAIQRRGLVTLERARMVTGELGGLPLREEHGAATKLTLYLGRRERVGGRPAFKVACEILRHHGVSGATALLGVDGTARGERRRARFFSANAEVPMMVVALGRGDQIAGALPELGRLLQRPLLTLERVRVCRRDGEPISPPHPPTTDDEHGLAMWQKLMVYTSEAAKHGRRPIHSELVRRLRRAGAAGVTAVRGVWGFHGEHAPHGDRLLQLRRHVPIVSVVVGAPQQVAGWFEIVEELTAERGLVTSEMVPAMTAMAANERRGGLRLAAPA